MISLIQCEYIDDKKNTKTLTNDLSAKAKTKFPAEYIYYAFIHRYTGTSHLNVFDPKHNIIRVIQLYITNINTTLMKNIQ